MIKVSISMSYRQYQAYYLVVLCSLIFLEVNCDVYFGMAIAEGAMHFCAKK
jgi:hypothetical protein